MDTFVLLAGRYADEASATADYEAVKDLYSRLGLDATFDAAVMTRDENGKVHLVHRHEQPTRRGAVGGLALGLAGGVVVALFPAVALAGGLIWGGAAGAGLGALVGHVAGGLSRTQLKSLGELLDEGQSGLIVVAAMDLEAQVEKEIRRAAKVEKAQLTADEAALQRDVEQAGAGTP